MQITKNASMADVIIRADKVSISHIFSIAIFSLYKSVTVYMEEFLHDDILYVRNDGELLQFCSVSDLWNWLGVTPVFDGMENPGYICSLVCNNLIRKIDTEDNDSIAFRDVADALFFVNSKNTAYEKAVDLAMMLVRKAIADAEKLAKEQYEMDCSLSNADGPAIVVNPNSNWIEKFWNSKVENNVEFVVMPLVDGTYKFSGIPCGFKPYNTVVKAVPAEWLKCSIEKVREITGVAGLLSLEPRGFGGVCKNKADAFAMVEAICQG